MEDFKIPEIICRYLSGMEGKTFIPEVWRDGCAMVSQSGGENVIRSYVNGGEIIAVPFEVSLRCDGQSIGDRLSAIDFFREIAEYIKAAPCTFVSEDICDLSVEAQSVASKSAIYEDGTEEYRAAYILKYYKKQSVEVV